MSTFAAIDMTTPLLCVIEGIVFQLRVWSWRVCTQAERVKCSEAELRCGCYVNPSQSKTHCI